MSIETATCVPRVERLLATAHDQQAMLQGRCRQLQQDGIDERHLPGNDALAAFALLGEHGREALVDQLDGAWQAMACRGLVYSDIAAALTPELRLLAHIKGLIWGLEPVELRLRGAENLAEPPPEMWRCPRRARGLRMQVARLHFVCGDPGVRFLLIDPDPVFRSKPILWAWPPNAGWISLPIQFGHVCLTLLHRDGRMFRMRIGATESGGYA